MKIRKIKKALKRTDNEWLIYTGLMSLKLIRKWANSKHYNAKTNIRILTNNFFRNGEFLF